MAESGRLRSFASRVVAERSPVGSNPTPSLPPSFFPSFDVWFQCLLAQLAEQATFNRRVTGSNPVGAIGSDGEVYLLLKLVELTHKFYFRYYGFNKFHRENSLKFSQV